MSIDNELLSFASSRAAWLRDCLRRICTQSDLSPKDIQEVFSNLKSIEGLDTAGQMIHLDATHLANRTSTAHQPTVLTSISGVQHANRLAPNQTLLFAESGITLIYGYNGSGKTGYGRILKQICRSRHDKQDPILGDVFAQVTAPPATAQIEYKVGGVSNKAAWTDGASTPKELSLISVFDATTAPLYADQQNRIEFLPLGLDVLPRLGKLCEHLAAEITNVMSGLNSKLAVPLPAVYSLPFSQFLSRLLATTPGSQVPTEVDIKTLCNWTSADEAALSAVVDEIRHLSAPAALSSQLARQISSIESLKPKMEASLSALTPETLAAAHRKLDDAKTARAAATIAAGGRFTGDPLGDAPTSGAWRKLYESAEAFSAEIYPDDQFPASGEGRVCLLCQQSIEQPAQERFERFRLFLLDTSQRDAQKAEAELGVTLGTVAAIAVPAAESIDQQLKELADTKPALVPLRDTIKQQCVALAALKAELIRCLRGEVEYQKLPSIQGNVIAEIDAALVGLRGEKKTFDDQTKNTIALDALKKKHTELLDRKSCASNLAIFLTRRQDLCTLESWKKCKSECDTTAISRKSTTLREAYLTKDFQNRVLNEVKNLGLDYLPLKVEGRTERGVGYIGVVLSKIGREPTSRILSEGEFRGLALACFFAEIATITGHDGIIVDDPVSSLDHLHVEQVARRLISEAKTRPQVIVFTHDLAFYYDLWMTAAEEQIPVHRNWIYKDGTSGFGHIASGDGPWQVKKTKERITILRGIVAALPEQAAVSPAEWQSKTEEFYSKLRETWERLVEECLLNEVVGRFQPGVGTLALKGVNVSDDDYRKVFFAMKKASEFSGHDRPAARQPTPRSKAEMDNDVGEIWNYEKEIKKRVDQLATQRRALETPPSAVTTPPTAT